jgi:hypothetical protein
MQATNCKRTQKILAEAFSLVQTDGRLQNGWLWVLDPKGFHEIDMLRQGCTSRERCC